MKYIDADKLFEGIKHLQDNFPVITYEALLHLITSLQQEQFNKDIGTLITCDIIEMTVKRAIDKPQDKEKEVELMTRKINYLRSLEENYVQQEQPEVNNQ